MEKEIKINDQVKVNDKIEHDEHHESPVKGIVRIYKDDKIIYEKHNTVVYSGRNLLLYLFKNYFGTTSKHTTGNMYINLSYLDSANYVITTPETELSHIEPLSSETSNTFPLISKKCEYAITDKDIPNKSTVAETDLHINFEISVNGDDATQKINQIYLTYVNNATDTTSNTEKILFSRVALDPIYLSANSKFKIKYTLYF